MKKLFVKRKLPTLLLALCMVLSALPFTAFAAASATETADFTADGGTKAINLLNEFKTVGAADSVWDNSSKTLTLRGIDFTTTAQTAVKLPAGSTIVLTDGTSNIIQSGDVTLAVSGDSKNQVFVNALDAVGNLTIQGGTGTLSILAGKLKNSGDGWVYSSGMAVNGDLTVKGGRVTVRGGSVESDGSCFSIGVNMDSDSIKNKALLVTGGTLTAIADKAYEMEEGGTKGAVFSRGVYMCQGNVIVSGDGKLRAESVEEMAEANNLSNGLYIFMGNLTVANSAEVDVIGAYGADIFGGSIQLKGGKLTAISTQAPDNYGNLGHALSVDVNSRVADSGNITVSGGTLKTVNGYIYISSLGAKENQGLFTVTGGTVVNEGQLYGPKKLDISGGTVQTQRIDSDALTLSGGSLTIREPVRKNSYNKLYALPALDVMTLVVSDGILDAAWDWDEYTPMVLPKDEEYNDVGILVRIPYDYNTATFTGGTTILDTGFAGNTALLIKGQLTLGQGMDETGADANHCQLKSDTPVKFAKAAAPTTIVTATIENAKFDYQSGDVPQATATVAAADQDKYEIAYECWQQFENNNPVAAWYSDNSAHGSLPTIEKFESGKKYVYSIMLEPKDGYSFSIETVVTVNGKKVSAPFVGGSMYIPAVKTITPIKQNSPIAAVDIESVKLNYQSGSAPQVTAKRAGVNQDKYDILYESWGKRVKDANDTITTVAYWYSDESYYSDGDVRFNTFEKGGRYQYSVRLRAKDGYIFDSDLDEDKVTLNGQTLPFGSWVNVLDDGKTCLITYGTETRPGQIVEAIRLDAVIDFEDGDKPRFSTGVGDPFVDTDHQRWDANDGSGYGITSSDYWNERYNGKLIEKFEADKTYTYGVYFKISDLGLEEGYRFDKTTKLYINGTNITLSPEQISLDDNGETIWFSNVLTMTPKPTKSWQKIDVVKIEGATINFKDGDKPVFTGKIPENAPYDYQFECWETKDGAGVNSAEFFDNAYQKHITEFKSGESYQYILYFKAKDGYYFTADTKIKINGTLYNYRLVNIDPDYDSSGKMFTFWAYTDLNMTPKASGKTPEYKITDGANGAYTKNTDGTLTFRANGDFSKFVGVKVDGNTISADKYTAVSGSTVVTLNSNYLGTLSVGEHTLSIVYTDGECSTSFEIKAAQNGGGSTVPEKSDKGNANSEKSPKTADNGNITLWIALLFINGGVMTCAALIGRKKVFKKS